MVSLEVILKGTTDGDFVDNPKIVRILNRNNVLYTEIDNSKIEYQTLRGESKIDWKPNMKRIENVVVKNARGHAMYEFDEPMTERPNSIIIRLFSAMGESEKSEFLNSNDGHGLWPEVGGRMMQRIITGDGLINGWVDLQEGFYRYSVNQQESAIRVKSIIREYLTKSVSWE